MTAAHALGQLGPDVSVVQFHLRGKAMSLPEEAWNNAEWMDPKHLASGAERSPEGRGERFIFEPDRTTSFAGFTKALGKQGYTLVHVGKRLADTKGGQMQYILRYSFGRVPRENEELRALGEGLCRELEAFAHEALWSIQAFRNPYYHDGQVIEGKSVITIDANARSPLFEICEGGRRPVMRWGKRDLVTGKGAGEKVPLAPNAYLDVDENGEVAIFVEELVDPELVGWSQVLRDHDQVRTETFGA